MGTEDSAFPSNVAKDGLSAQRPVFRLTATSPQSVNKDLPHGELSSFFVLKTCTFN